MRRRYLAATRSPFCAVALEAERKGERRPAHCLGIVQEWDHVTPLHLGGSDELDDLQGLCRPCHKAKTADERRQRQRLKPPPDWAALQKELMDETK